MRDETLKIAAAPAGQPGSATGLFPSPPKINANTSADVTAMIAMDNKTGRAIVSRVRVAIEATLRGSGRTN
jgi:hypothetical protein